MDKRDRNMANLLGLKKSVFYFVLTFSPFFSHRVLSWLTAFLFSAFVFPDDDIRSRALIIFEVWRGLDLRFGSWGFWISCLSRLWVK